jgi:hypothetical protein
MIRSISLSIFLLLLPNSEAATANPPEAMSYQGFLTDSNGNALGSSAPANYDIVFRIMDAKEGGSTHWAEQQTVTVDKGYFSILLGEGSVYGSDPRPALSSVFNDPSASDRFVELTVLGLPGGNVTIMPRLRLISSPFAFKAASATTVGDGSGNSMIYKDGSKLHLGTGAAPMLTLSEEGTAVADGKMVTNLPTWGSGITINNGSSTTSLGAQNASYFHFETDRPAYYFNRPLHVAGDIRTYDRDMILGSSNRPQTQIKIHSAQDQIDLSAKDVFFRNNSQYLNVEVDENAVDLVTSSPNFYMNKPLKVSGRIQSSEMLLEGWIGRSAHNNGALVGSYNNVGGNGRATNPIYTIGSNYKPGSETLENFYGIGYSDGSASFLSGSASGWGLYVASDGDARTFLGAASGANSYIHRDGGRLGIGTSNPGETLDVNGTLRVNSYTYLKSRIYGTGSQYFYVNNAHDNGVEIVGHTHNNGRIGNPSIQWDDGYITELWASVQGSDRRLKKDIVPAADDEMLDLIERIPFYQYRLRFNNDEKMINQGRDPDGYYYGVLAQELRELYPNVVKSSGNFADLDESATDEETIRSNHWYVEKDRLAELALGGVKDLSRSLKEKDKRIAELEKDNLTIKAELKVLKDQVAALLNR